MGIRKHRHHLIRPVFRREAFPSIMFIYIFDSANRFKIACCVWAVSAVLSGAVRMMLPSKKGKDLKLCKELFLSKKTAEAMSW